MIRIFTITLLTIQYLDFGAKRGRHAKKTRALQVISINYYGTRIHLDPRRVSLSFLYIYYINITSIKYIILEVLVYSIILFYSINLYMYIPIIYEPIYII